MAVLNLAIAASAHDVHCNTGSTITAADLTHSAVQIGNPGTGHDVGLHFEGLSVLAGATITNAVLTFRSLATDTGSFVGDWYGEDSATPAAFSEGQNLSTKARTTATCEGDGTDFGVWTGATFPTFSGDGVNTLAEIVQELVDAYSPDAINLLWIYTSGSGERIAESFDGNPASAITLDITYTPGGSQGTGALTLPFLSVAGTGEKVYTGTGAIQVPSPLSVAGSGLQSHIATAAFILPIIQVAGSGLQKITAASAISLPIIAVFGSGSHVSIVEGTGALVLPLVNLIASGVMLPEGVGALTTPLIQLAATGLQIISGSAVFNLPLINLEGTGLNIYTGTSNIVLPLPALSGSGLQSIISTGALSLPIIELTGAGSHTDIQGSGALTLPLISLIASGIYTIVGTGAITTPLIVVTASGIHLISGTGAFTLPVVVISTGIGLLVLPRKVLEYILELPKYSRVVEVPSYETILRITTSSKVLTLPELAQTLPIIQPSTTREL